MTSKKLHPSVEKFKDFVKANPNIVKDVREGKSTWQELYEDWYLLGEDDSRWDSFRTGKAEKTNNREKQSDWMANVMGSIKNMDPSQMQGYIQNISQALSAVQGVISQFQGGNQGPPPKTSSQKPNNPFAFRKD